MADNPAPVEVGDTLDTGVTQATVGGGSTDAAPVVLPAFATLAAAATEGTSGLSTPGIGTTGTMTPMVDPEQVEHSLKVSLADLTAKATALYALKSYPDAAEVFAQAAEMQAEINGEMSPTNAEILFLYGRSLYKVGQAKSDVLGNKAPESKKKPTKKPKKAGASKPAEAAKPDEQTPADRITEEGVAAVAAEAAGSVKKDEATTDAKKPMFQFVGDENWDDSDEEDEEDDEEGGEEEEEDDDLGTAYEILDLARVLYGKRMVELEAESSDGKGKEKSSGDSAALRHVKERLADAHDLLAEISLEGERFHNAIQDSSKSLEYKKDLYPQESDIVAEAHFKLSLALEYASVTTQEEDKDKGDQTIDQGLRDEAAKELEAAIDSTKLKLQNKEVELATNHSPDDNDVTRREIADVKEIIADMEQRLVDLRGLPMDVEAMLGDGNPLGGILGAALGETPKQVAARVEEAKKTANDLTGLVRKKPTAAPAPAPSNGSAETNDNGTKRKLEDTEPEAVEETKKARVEEPAAAAATET